MAGLILWGMNMIYQERYVYHIKDEYFEKVQDFNFMQNKEGGTHRPISLETMKKYSGSVVKTKI